ncbi:hypothetical protein ACMFMG_000397 [Clarireedia jacksonii]
MTESTANVTLEPVNTPTLQHEQNAREPHRRELADEVIKKLTGLAKEDAMAREALRRDMYDRGLELSAPEPDPSSTLSRILVAPNTQNTESTTLPRSPVGPEGKLTNIVTVDLPIARSGNKITKSLSPTSDFMDNSRKLNSPQDDDRWSRAATPGTDYSASTPSTRIDNQQISLDSISNPQIIGGYSCLYPGCTAPPFLTQYLLNSHSNIHSLSRPHFCPVKGCPRGEGRKGFKSKNQMKRHVFMINQILIPQSPRLYMSVLS